MKIKKLFVLAIVVLMLIWVMGCSTQNELGSNPPSGDQVGTKATCVHNWQWQNIFEFNDTGSDSTHQVFGQQICSKCYQTRIITQNEPHNYYYNWYCYYKYSASQHELRQDYICSTCNHKKTTSTYEPHQWESIYDTYCDLCGQTR